MKKLIFLLTLVPLLTFTSCSDESQLPIDPLAIGGNDDLNPDPGPGDGDNPAPTPTPTPPPQNQRVTITLEPSDLNKDDTNIVYRSYIKAVGLNEPRKHRKCPDNFKNQCVVNRQILFQFNVDEINKDYPQELWDITFIELKADYYSLGEKYRTELLCVLNNKICSGKAITKIAGIDIPFVKLLWRNPRFWRGRDENHVVSESFHAELLSGKVQKDFFIRKNLTMSLSRTFNLADTELQTLVRKNEGIQMSVTDDTYVEFPTLKIGLKRRVPERF